MPEKLHAATMWIVHIGTVLSAYFILAANSFMQHPVGYTYNKATGRAELTDFFAVLTNKVQLVTFPHVIFAAYMAGGAVVMGVALWLMRREAKRAADDAQDVARTDAPMYRRATRIAAVVTLVAARRRRRHRRRPGQDHDRGPADEDGGGRGALRAPCPAASGALLGADGRLARRLARQRHHRGPRPAQLPRDRGLQRRGQGHQRPQGRSTPRRYGASGNPLVADTTTAYVPNIPTTYWRFRLMIGLGHG